MEGEQPVSLPPESALLVLKPNVSSSFTQFLFKNNLEFIYIYIYIYIFTYRF